jgi:hypothetical protein
MATLATHMRQSVARAGVGGEVRVVNDSIERAH